MKKAVLAIICGALLSTATFTAAQAQEVNLSKFSCGDFLQLSKEKQLSVTAWIAGLLTAELKQAQPTLDLNAFAPVTENMVKICTGKEEGPLSGMALEVFSYMGE